MKAKLFHNWVYIALFVSFILLISSLSLAYTNLNKGAVLIQNLSTTQMTLNTYANSLNYAVKKNQANTLQYLALHKNLEFVDVKEEQKEIQKNIQALQKIAKQNKVLSLEFSKILQKIKKRAIGYQLVQQSLLDALQTKNQEDIQDALIGYNMIATKFSYDVALLQNEIKNSISIQIEALQKTNKRTSQVLIYSFIIATLLIVIVVIKLQLVSKRIALQLELTEDAQHKLQKAQEQLLEYNENLEEQINKKTQELHKKIYTSFLTGLDNRNKLLEDNVNLAFANMAILDIDKFQTFNDVYGEELGNIALQQTAQWLKEYLEDKKINLYHIGGDEFVIACNNVTLAHSAFIELIEKLLNDFKSQTFFYEDKEYRFIMSAGITFVGEKKMLAFADMALKDAKKHNKPISIYEVDKDLEKEHIENLDIYKKLLYAFEHHLLISYYQPIVPIQDHTKPQKYESLIRLKDKDGNLYPPFKFLEVAKANRVYYKITRTVIDNVFGVIQKHHIACSLNLSLTDIINEKTLGYLIDRLNSFEHPELLTIELLETEHFDNYEQVHSFCVKVRGYGVKIALDDFGSGYSNFSHVLNLPIDFIKIDATLISNIDRDISSQIMVETIVNLAKKLNVQTIAEFVATGDILEMVRSLGVDYAQGFHLGKPLPIEEHLA